MNGNFRGATEVFRKPAGEIYLPPFSPEGPFLFFAILLEGRKE